MVDRSHPPPGGTGRGRPIAKHGLYLVDLKPDRDPVRFADACKRSGHLLDHDAAQSAWDGAAELPVLVAASDLQAPLILIGQYLEAGGCMVCLVEDGSGERVGAGLAEALRRAPDAVRGIGREMRQNLGARAARLAASLPVRRGGATGLPSVDAVTAPGAGGGSIEDEGGSGPPPVLRLRPAVVALRVGVLIAFVAAAAAGLHLLLRYEPSSRPPTAAAVELKMLPQGGTGRMSAPSGSGRAAGAADRAPDARAEAAGEAASVEDASGADEGPVAVPDIALSESAPRPVIREEAAAVDLGALLLGFSIAFASSLLIPAGRARASGGGKQVVGGLATAALVAFAWVWFVHDPVRAGGGEGGPAVTLASGEEGPAGAITPPPFEDPSPTSSPAAPFRTFVDSIGGEPSSCSSTLPRFQALLCQMREMGATQPPQDPGQALAAAALAGEEGAPAGGSAGVGPDGDGPAALDPEAEGGGDAAGDEGGGDASAGAAAEDGPGRSAPAPGRAVAVGAPEAAGAAPRSAEPSTSAPPASPAGGTESLPGGGASGAEGGPDRVEIAAGAAPQKPPPKRPPLRTRLTWLAFGCLGGWFLLGFGRSFVLGGGED